MDRLIYTAMSGMGASMLRQRMIASNMANAQTIGFKAEQLDARPVTLEGESMEVRAMNRSEVRGASMREGAVNPTGRELDVALTGDVMLALQASDGSEAYTRRGDLSVTAAGVLQNGDGLPVMGENGPLTVPAGAHVAIAEDGGVLVSDPTQPDQPAQRVGRLKLASTKGSEIEKGLDGLFRVKGGGVLPSDADARLIPGALEQSNVVPSQVLVDMIEAQRLFEIRTNIVSTARDLDEGSARLMRLDG
ncbi:MAG: flagellar basal body rod protein FlgF [Novosphingobium sp.]|nr:flagellar basal body rod protein FlgF [Novosphingobium sp.]